MTYDDPRRDHDYLARLSADCIRDCLRAIAADSPGARRYHAVQHFSQVVHQLAEASSPNLHFVFDAALEQLRPSLPEDSADDRHASERAYVAAAKRGMQYLAELSATDGAAGGRASKRQADFQASIEWIDRARDLTRRHYDKQRKLDGDDPEAAMRRATDALEKRGLGDAVMRSFSPPRGGPSKWRSTKKKPKA